MKPSHTRAEAGSSEIRICGVPAVRARFQRKPGSIQRLYFDYPTGRTLGLMCKALAAARKIYRCVEPAELEKIAGTVHHGGAVVVVSEPPPAEATAADIAAWAARREPLLVLDRIANPHNLGAIARTAAFFGVPRIVIPRNAEGARPNDAAYRVAEGGLESVEVRTAFLPDFLRALAAAGYDVVGASVRDAGPIKARALDSFAKAGPNAAVAVVLGNEEEGLSADTAQACTRLVTIPGSGAVESLNVSAAAAVLLWQLVSRKPHPKGH